MTFKLIMFEGESSSSNMNIYWIKGFFTRNSVKNIMDITNLFVRIELNIKKNRENKNKKQITIGSLSSEFEWINFCHFKVIVNKFSDRTLFNGVIF